MFLTLKYKGCAVDEPFGARHPQITYLLHCENYFQFSIFENYILQISVIVPMYYKRELLCVSTTHTCGYKDQYLEYS